MGFIEIFLIAVSLSMDAFAVSLCIGMPLKNNKIRSGLRPSLYFGFFQALMPLLGYLLGTYFSKILDKVDHFIVFIVLGFIGFSMIKNSLKNESNESNNISIKELLVLSVATSIDALAVGTCFAFLKVNIILAIIIIGTVCFSISFIGILIGNKFGTKYEKKSTLLGGIILFLIGLKILLEHLGVF